MFKLTDPIIRFAAQTLQRAEVFNLRAVSSTFENAVFNTALPAHTAKVTLGVDDDAELQQAAAMTSRVGSRVKGLPITLRAFVEPLSESSFTALKQIAPNVVKIIIMDAASNTSYNCEPWHQVKFPNLRFLRVYAPPNQLYYKPKDVVAILVHSLLKHHGKYLRDFELKNQTNRGAIECVDLRIPSEITSITGTFHEFPEAYFEAAKELSLLVYMNIVCYTPASRDRAEKLIQSLFERWSHTLQILTIECCFVPSTVQLVCSGPFVLIKLIMKDLELLLLDGVCKFGTIFPKLISIEISRLSGSTNEFVEINWIPSILTDMKLRKFHSLSTNGSADMLEHQPLKFFINFPFLRRLTIGFPNIITTQIALQEIFRTSMAIEELSIGCTRSLAERPGLDLNHLLTSVTSADSFRGRSTWKALRQHEHPSISDLKGIQVS